METSTNPVQLILLWAIVVVPLSWGVYHTILSALKLFS